MNEPIRVLHVLHCTDCGGAENMIMNLYRNIDRSKVQFDFLVHTRKKGFFDAEIKSLGGHIYHVPYYYVANELWYRAVLNDFFKKHPEIRIVHGHLGSCAHIYLSVAKKYGCFAIAHSHSTDSKSLKPKSIAYKFFNLFTRRIADYFFACGTEAGLARYGKRVTKSNYFKCINNAIDSDRYIYSENFNVLVRNEFGLKNELILGHIGRMDEAKNQQFAIHVLKELLNKRKDAKLILIGDGQLRSILEDLAKNLGVEDDVIFTGIRSDVPKLLNAMDCFVFPSHYEGLPVTVIEAQAAGLKCFISEAVTKEVDITGRCEFLPIVDPKLWADKILSSELTKVDTSEQIKAAGYDIHTTAKQLQRFYLKISERSK